MGHKSGVMKRLKDVHLTVLILGCVARKMALISWARKTPSRARESSKAAKNADEGAK